jgi:hypothetical protein
MSSPSRTARGFTPFLWIGRDLEGMLWVAEGHRAAPRAVASWIAEGGLGVHLRGSRLQFGPKPKSTKAMSIDRLKGARVPSAADNSSEAHDTGHPRPKTPRTRIENADRRRDSNSGRLFSASLLGESREAASVQPSLDVAVPDALQINHGRGNIPVPHPHLQGADVYAVLQVARGVCMAALVQEIPAAVGPLAQRLILILPSDSSCLTTQWQQFSLPRQATGFSVSSIAPSGFPVAV